jgi:ribosomal protection tetracycline resistance protein
MSLHTRNIGIIAHADAGKTTITEQLLFQSGRIRSIGKVDTGTASTDWLQVERERGISVKAASTFFTWNGYNINLIDTPGHKDFSSEEERSLTVLDGAILVVSAVEGVQAQTEVLWGALQKMGIPTLIFMNKLDRIGANPQRVIEEMSQFLTPAIVPIQVILGIEKDFHHVKSIFDQEFLSLNKEQKKLLAI